MELQNKPIADNKFGAKSYIDAAGLQALIDKIAGLRKSLLDADAAGLQTALDKIGELSTELKQLIQDNTDADKARETRLETVETKVNTIETVTVPALEKADADEAVARDAADKALEARVETNEENITNLQNTKADKTELKDWVLTTTFNEFKTSVESDLAAILAALQNIVASTDVEQAYDDAVAKTDAPAEEGNA